MKNIILAIALVLPAISYAASSNTIVVVTASYGETIILDKNTDTPVNVIKEACFVGNPQDAAEILTKTIENHNAFEVVQAQITTKKVRVAYKSKPGFQHLEFAVSATPCETK